MLMKQRSALLAFSILMLGLFANIHAQERYARPVDEGKSDPSFARFRNNLIRAVERKDKKYLLRVLDPSILNSFGGDGGIDEFASSWELDKPGSAVWAELLTVLKNGGKFVTGPDRRTFCAPYSFKAFPDDLDAFEHNVIFGSRVRLRSRPNLRSKIIGKLSYNIVRIDWENSVTDRGEVPTYTWFKVETLGGKKGYVSAEYVRSPIDYRACFEKTNGLWKMTTFVSGD